MEAAGAVARQRSFIRRCGKSACFAEIHTMSLYEITVDAEFTATHSLPLSGGGSEPPHEHLWGVSATFRSDRLAEPMGVVIDFIEVRDALDAVTGELEGGDLNRHDAMGNMAPSAERVAECIAELLAQKLGDAAKLLYRVEVTEAPGCRAAFYPKQKRT